MEKTVVPISDVKLGQMKSDGLPLIFQFLEAVAFHNQSNREVGVGP